MESTHRLISVKKDSTVNSFDGPNNNLASPPKQFLQFHVIMEGNFYMIKRSDMITDHIGING